MRTLILVLYGAGLRLGKATRLKHEDADFRNVAPTIRETKFGVPAGPDRKRSDWRLQTLPNAISAAVWLRAPRKRVPKIMKPRMGSPFSVRVSGARTRRVAKHATELP